VNESRQQPKVSETQGNFPDTLYADILDQHNAAMPAIWPRLPPRPESHAGGRPSRKKVCPADPFAQHHSGGHAGMERVGATGHRQSNRRMTERTESIRQSAAFLANRQRDGPGDRELRPQTIRLGRQPHDLHAAGWHALRNEGRGRSLLPRPSLRSGTCQPVGNVVHALQTDETFGLLAPFNSCKTEP
jgi:hypothetical protein